MASKRPEVKQLTPAKAQQLLAVLEARFVQHPHRHPGLDWADVRARLEVQPDRLWSLSEMERTGGEPDAVTLAGEAGITFCDCARETPTGRRSLCYDDAALDACREAKPAGSALGLAVAMGVELLSEAQYRTLQQLEPLDTKTSSWLLTPADIRALGGALFGDYRYGHVFVYHNGAQSYYAARAFRALLRV